MVLRHHYLTPATPGNAATDTEVTASLRLGTLAGATTEASLLAVGSSGVEVDDTFAEHDFVKHKTWAMVQDAAPAGGAIAGTVTKASGSTTVTGSGTAFTALLPGQELTIPGGGGSDAVQVASVASDTSMTVTVAPAHSASGQVATLAPRQRAWTGYTGDQHITRGEEFDGAARHWSVDLSDVNSLPHFRVIQADDGSFDSHHAKRPAENADDRMHWFLSVDFLSDTLWDEGLVNWTALALVPLDANDYTGSYGDQVLNDVIQATRLDGFVHFREATVHDELFLDRDRSAAGPGGRTLDAHTPGGPTRVTNVDSEVDDADPATQTTFAVEWPDATLQRGGDIFAGVWGRDSKGHTSYQTRAQTAYDFGWRDGVAQVPAGISSQAKLDAYCRSVRDDSKDQTLLLKFRLLVRAAQMTCLLAGERFQAHLTHLPGLDAGFVWCRAIRVTPSDAPGETQEAYYLDVEATPFPPATCSMSFSSRVTDSVSDQTGGSGSYGISVTPAEQSAVIVGFVAGGTGMSISGGGVTEVNSYADTGHETLAHGWLTSDSAVTVTASYTITGNPQAAVIAAFPTAATAPVQLKATTWEHGSTITLDSPPTPGNMLVAIVTNSKNGDSSMASDWVGDDADHKLAFIKQGNADGVHPFGGDSVAIFAACVGDGTWGSSWSYDQSGAASNFDSLTVMEWPVS